MTRCCFAVADFLPVDAGELFAAQDKASLTIGLSLPRFVEPPRVAASLIIAHNAKIELLDAKRDVGFGEIHFTIKAQLPSSTPYVGLLVDCEDERMQLQVTGVAMHIAQVRPTWPPSRCLLRALENVAMVRMHAEYPETPLTLIEPFIQRVLDVDAGLGLQPVPGILYAALVHGQLLAEGAST